MDARMMASALDVPTVQFDVPEAFEHDMTDSAASVPSACPACESVDLLSEEALDEDGMPTGLLLVTCAVCGRELGELAPPAPGPEAEPELAAGSLLPGPSEEPRGPVRLR